ncbi:MAG: DUF1592 domain-containing protein [Planctomycetes bacterium]|nr:DUF1592 domain-containing protein [Planctomycetota bacterium]
MSIHIFRFSFAFLAFLVLAGTSPAQDRAAFEARFKKLADGHCIGCHGPDVQKYGLRLDKLTAKFDEKDSFNTWVKVLDKIAKGEMPPKDEERPPEKRMKAVVAELQRHLQETSLAKQHREGRVILRRLNRIEYETTLRDLLGPHVEVKEMLPDDNSAAGFDNVSAVLDISSAHLLRYQDAAEKALQGLIPNRPQPTFKDRRTGKEIVEKQPIFKSAGQTVKVVGDSMVMHVRTYGHMPCASNPVPVAGKYRVKASVQATGTDGKVLPVMFSWRDLYGSDSPDTQMILDAPTEKGMVLEGVFDMKQRNVIVLNGWSLPSPRDFENRTKGKKVDDYDGPSLVVNWIEIEGPLDPWPPVPYQRLFEGVPLKPKSVAAAEALGQKAEDPTKRDLWWLYNPLVPAPAKPREEAERLMRAFLPQAFRRPVSKDLQDYYVKIVHDALDKKMLFSEAMLHGYKVALCSPHFLFITERVDESKTEKRTTLDDYAVASRLSYFFWSSLPDDELLKLAAKGELSKPAVLHEQVERMLKDRKAHRFTDNFAGQWLDLRNINATSPDPEVYSEFDDFLFWSMPRETRMFFEEILRNDLPLTDFVHSDWTFLNQRLAQHYGIKNVVGGELRKVKLPADCHRGGVLTHASIMKVTADGTKSSPVLRGRWVLEKIIGLPPAPPPPDIPAIEPDIRGATTIRQQLDKHRNTKACATCHVHIDPPGFALENFDVIGGWRDFYRASKPIRDKLVDLTNYPGRKIYRALDVEKGGQTPEGKPFKDIDEYKQILLADKDQLARNLAQKLLIYATGADIQFADREVVEQLVAKCREKKYGFRSLVHEVVLSRVFLNK